MIKHPAFYLAGTILIAAALVAFVYGAVMPITRGGGYIEGVRNFQKIKTVEDFKNVFGPVLDHPTPIGDEEIPKYMLSDIANIISQENITDEVATELVNFIEPYIDETNVRHLLAMGGIYRAMWQRTETEDNFRKSEAYYSRAMQIGPKLPPVLYGLLELYANAGDKENMRRIGNLMLEYWPNLDNVRELIK